MPHPLLIAAEEAEAAFTAELKRQFGVEVGMRRYETKKHDAATKAAAKRFHEAMDAWLPVARHLCA